MYQNSCVFPILDEYIQYIISWIKAFSLTKLGISYISFVYQNGDPYGFLCYFLPSLKKKKKSLFYSSSKGFALKIIFQRFRACGVTTSILYWSQVILKQLKPLKANLIGTSCLCNPQGRMWKLVTQPSKRTACQTSAIDKQSPKDFKEKERVSILQREAHFASQ